MGVRGEKVGEVGYLRTIAFRALVLHYLNSPKFTEAALSFRQALIQRQRTRIELLDILFHPQDKEPFDIATQRWENLWHATKASAKPLAIKATENLARQWGLHHCRWGCGLIMDVATNRAGHIGPLLDLIFEPLPLPENTRLDYRLHLEPLLTAKQHRAVVKELEYKLDAEHKNIREHFLQKGYQTNDVRAPFLQHVQWLFWHITPPYLTPTEIALVDDTGRSEYHIAKAYRATAKQLKIELKPGYQSGHQRQKSDA